MPYPKKLLNDHETIALDLRPHWSYVLKPVLMLIAAVIVGLFTLIADDSWWEDVLTWISIALLVGSAVWLVARYIQWVSINFVVTSDRVIYRSGIFAKSGIEIPLDRVNNVIFNQGFFERILGTGNLLIESGGETGQQKFTDVRNPDQVQKLIHAQKSAKDSQHRQAPSAPAAGGDVATQLEKLEGMLQRGSLTQAEFDAQKQRLLGG